MDGEMDGGREGEGEKLINSLPSAQVAQSMLVRSLVENYRQRLALYL